MANMHVQQFSKIPDVAITCCCDILPERVAAFAAKHNIPGTFTDPAEMLAKGDVDAVTVVTNDATHAPLSIQCLEAGKHVLCEKPLATSLEDAFRMVEVAEKSGRINMINLSYRNSSAWQRACQMIADGELGQIMHFQAHYLQSWLSSADWGDWKTKPAWLWRLSSGHGSLGALGDVGVHILDFATSPIGSAASVNCRLKCFDKAPGNQIGEYKLDANDTALLTVECETGALGTVAITRWATGHLNSLALSIHGTKGAIRIDLDRSYELLECCRLSPDGFNQPWETLYCGKTPSIYERFISSIRSGQQDQPDFACGAKVQAILDAALRSAESGLLEGVQKCPE